MRAASRVRDASSHPPNFPVTAPDSLVGLPRKDVRLVGSDTKTALAVYGQGLRGPKGQRMDGDYRITDYQPPNRLAFEVIAGPARPTGAFDLEEPVAGATMVRFSLDLQAKGLMKVPMRFAGKVIERQMRAEVDCLSRLKDQLEGEEAEDEAEGETPEA